jgi:hypothetical protein
MGEYLLFVPIDATGENGFKDKQDCGNCFYHDPYIEMNTNELY